MSESIPERKPSVTDQNRSVVSSFCFICFLIFAACCTVTNMVVLQAGSEKPPSQSSFHHGQKEAGRRPTVAPSRTLELGLDGQQSHVPHQPGLGEHEVRVIRLGKHQNIWLLAYTSCHISQNKASPNQE